MAKFKATVGEYLERVVEVEADNPTEARLKIDEALNNGELVLTDDDHAYFEIKALWPVRIKERHNGNR